MPPLRVRLHQSEWNDGMPDANQQRALAAIRSCAGQADLLVLPECCLQGFATPATIAALAMPITAPLIGALREAAREAQVSVVFGFAEVERERLFNSAVLVDEHGDVLLKYRKTHLYKSDQGVFEAGTDFPVCVWHGLRVGLLICFDIEFPEPARVLASQGAELIVVADGNMDFSAALHRQIIPVRALENQVHVVMANRVGQGNDYAFGGESQAADPFGRCLALASAHQAQVLDVVLDRHAVARARSELDYLHLARTTAPGLPRLGDPHPAHKRGQEPCQHR
jgi:(R)-amidase